MTRLVVFGDSISANMSPTNWPTLLQSARPTIQVCNGSASGRTTDSLALFDGTMAYANGGGTVTDVAILLGMADLITLGSTPAETVTRLRALATRAVSYWNARAWVLTLLPAWKIPLRPDLDGWSFGIEVNHEWYRQEGANPTGATTLDVRDDVLHQIKWDSAAATDGLHPSALAAHQAIARVPIAVLP
jgi:hypothetical protein